VDVPHDQYISESSSWPLSFFDSSILFTKLLVRPKTVITCSSAGFFGFDNQSEWAVMTMFRICLPFSGSMTHSCLIVVFLSKALLRFCIQICSRWAGFRARYSIARVILDSNALSIMWMRFVVRQSMPSKYSSLRRKTLPQSCQ